MITDTGHPPVIRLLSDTAVLARGGCPAHRRVRADLALGPAPHRPFEVPALALNAVLDLVEHRGRSLERACAHLPAPGRPAISVLGERVPAVHDGVRAWVRHAARAHLAATTGRTPVRDFWVRQYMPEPGSRHRRPYEVRAAGRCYTDGPVRELWAPSLGGLRRPLSPDAGIAVAAYVLATGSPVDRDAYAADPRRYHDGAPYPMRGRGRPPERVRVIQVSCLDGATAVRFDGTADEAGELFAAKGREGLRAALVGGARAPGADCLTCGVRRGCGRLPRAPGLLGSSGGERRSWSPALAREFALCPARAHFHALGLPAVIDRRPPTITPRPPQSPPDRGDGGSAAGVVPPPGCADTAPASPDTPETPGSPGRGTGRAIVRVDGSGTVEGRTGGARRDVVRVDGAETDEGPRPGRPGGPCRPGGSGGRGSGVVAEVVRAWLRRAHDRLPRRACEPADLPVDPSRWACAGRRLFGDRARRAAAMLAAHIPVCPLRDLPAGDHVRSGPTLTADDTDADVLVVHRADVLHHRRGSWVHRTVLIAEDGPPEARGPELFADDPRAALGVLFFAAGVIAAGPEPAVEMEVLAPDGARVDVVDPASPPVLAAAERTVRTLVAPWHRDRVHAPAPGPVCRTCPYHPWCPASEREEGAPS
ncbi:hypothetical protein PWG71_18230 [Nocardiopsis sp. N85]|uniref:hypothetical protein n=1 Tax=Nocardiopsis sp. N85 TaxID=3029400 RepID=UPI00237F0B72|nr:hypothetical protein [Nocardiopsis sp. N85]MDE3723335.1 hypothetical protein [Nocardiopsis sp. N85]